jgi:hypothetical protein
VLQYPIILPFEQPETIRSLLTSIPGFTEEYIQETVQTIFLNGVAADSADLPLSPGDRLSLSAAMPGLAGAIFRRGGEHKSLRSNPQQPAQQISSTNGLVYLKLFNSIAAERGLEMLNQGIMISSANLIKFLTTRPEPLTDTIVQIKLDGRVVSTEGLIKDTSEDIYLLQIIEM